jgi:hypothetical protein
MNTDLSGCTKNPKSEKSVCVTSTLFRQSLLVMPCKLNLHKSSPVNRGTPSISLTTDASFVGWGAEFNGQSTGGNWSLSELETANINFLELQTVYLGLGCFLEELYDKHVKICSDNSTAVAYINNCGGTKSMSCNFKARQIWELVISKHIWITAVHLPGVDNVS